MFSPIQLWRQGLEQLEAAEESWEPPQEVDERTETPIGVLYNVELRKLYQVWYLAADALTAASEALEASLPNDPKRPSLEETFYMRQAFWGMIDVSFFNSLAVYIQIHEQGVIAAVRKGWHIVLAKPESALLGEPPSDDELESEFGLN